MSHHLIIPRLIIQSLYDHLIPPSHYPSSQFQSSYDPTIPSHYLTISLYDHLIIRHLIVQHLIVKPSHYPSFITPSYYPIISLFDHLIIQAYYHPNHLSIYLSHQSPMSLSYDLIIQLIVQPYHYNHVIIQPISLSNHLIIQSSDYPIILLSNHLIIQHLIVTLSHYPTILTQQLIIHLSHYLYDVVSNQIIRSENTNLI